MKGRQATCLVSSEADLDSAVWALLQFAEGRKKFALVGDLGAGKTTFVKAFCNWLIVLDNVSSPTFALVNEYIFLGENGQENCVHHLDLYRLESKDEALGIGIEDYLYDDCYCLIEWPEIIADLLPEDTVFVEIATQPDNSRFFLFTIHEPEH